VLCLGLAGCSRRDTSDIPATPRNTTEAAAQLEEVFAESPPEVQTTAAAATEALRTRDYERAVVAVQAMQDQRSLTLEQGLVVRNSMVTLQKQLVEAAERGDPQAKRAFEMIKRMNPK
jgi:hypothetical protein